MSFMNEFRIFFMALKKTGSCKLANDISVDNSYFLLFVVLIFGVMAVLCIEDIVHCNYSNKLKGQGTCSSFCCMF